MHFSEERLAEIKLSYSLFLLSVDQQFLFRDKVLPACKT